MSIGILRLLKPVFKVQRKDVFLHFQENSAINKILLNFLHTCDIVKNLLSSSGNTVLCNYCRVELNFIRDRTWHNCASDEYVEGSCFVQLGGRDAKTRLYIIILIKL
jgi:hypothetical protein